MNKILAYLDDFDITRCCPFVTFGRTKIRGRVKYLKEPFVKNINWYLHYVPNIAIRRDWGRSPLTVQIKIRHQNNACKK